MKKYSVIAAVAGTLLVTGCDKAGTPSGQTGTAPAVPAASTADAIAIVNGKPISKASMEVVMAEIKERRGGANVPEDKIVEELIKRELLSQEAESQGLGKDPKHLARIENANRMLLSGAGAEHYVATVQIGDEELKKEYDQRIGPMKGAEYRARHILVDAEQLAKEIIAKLGKGEKFDALAKKYSKDPGSKDKGGELGWFNPQQMVPPFSEAVAGLKNGEITKTPVQSQFGWHVIEREESREQPAPPFEAVKEQLKSMIQTQKLQQHLEDLKAKAKIENRLPKPAPAVAPTAKPGPAEPTLEAGQPKPPAAAPAPAQPGTPPAPAPTPAAKP